MPTPQAGRHQNDNTIRMFSKHRPYRFHIELTDKCNAACPMCPRTLPLDHCRPDRGRLHNHDILLDEFTRSFPPDFARRVARVDLCGGLGDPLAARHCLEICRYLVEHGVLCTISTNGSLRSEKWWRRLGEIFRSNRSFVELHVDGLRDSNRYYRVNTDFDKIMRNIRAYLETGAVAEWHYILFEHNEADVFAAHDLAGEMGFDRFVLTDTGRFHGKDRFDYQMPDGARRQLRPPRVTAAEYARQLEAQDGKVRRLPPKKRSPAAVNGISCKSRIENRPYITADGQVSACCWMAGSSDESRLQRRSGRSARDFNIYHRPLEEILLDEPFASLYEDSWRSGDCPVCTKKCGREVRSRRVALAQGVG